MDTPSTRQVYNLSRGLIFGIPHGILRGILTDLPKAQARNILGRTITATGRYAADRDDRPRLMQVTSLQVRAQAEPEQLAAAL